VIFGGAGALGGALGVIAGGVMGDKLAASGQNSRRVLVVMGSFAISLIPNLILLSTQSITVAFFAVFPLWFFLSAALGSGSGVLVSIVPASVRATATAAFLLSATMIGLAMGPYAAGRISHAFDSLRIGLTGILVVVPFALLALYISWRDLKRKEA
jgi:MFS family permease